MNTNTNTHIYKNALYVIIASSKFNDEIGESRQKSNQQSIQKCESQIMPMKRNSARNEKRKRNSGRAKEKKNITR